MACHTPTWACPPPPASHSTSLSHPASGPRLAGSRRRFDQQRHASQPLKLQRLDGDDSKVGPAFSLSFHPAGRRLSFAPWCRSFSLPLHSYLPMRAPHCDATRPPPWACRQVVQFVLDWQRGHGGLLAECGGQPQVACSPRLQTTRCPHLAHPSTRSSPLLRPLSRIVSASVAPGRGGENLSLSAADHCIRSKQTMSCCPPIPFISNQRIPL